MQNQNIRCLTGDEIRRKDRDAQNEASREYYMQALENMQNKFDQIVSVANSGETVTVFDQWGESVVLSKQDK